MFHFIEGFLFASAAVFTCKGEFQCAEGNHFAFAVIKTQKLGVILALFNSAACVQCLIGIFGGDPAAFVDKNAFYLIPIVFPTADLIKIKMNESGNVSCPGRMPYAFTERWQQLRDGVDGRDNIGNQLIIIATQLFEGIVAVSQLLHSHQRLELSLF